LYRESSTSAGPNIYHYAITHELWAKYLLTIPEEHYNSCFHLSEAIRGFTMWGGVAKAQQLARQYEAIIPHSNGSHKKLDEDIDIETIQYELSGDMEVAS